MDTEHGAITEIHIGPDLELGRARLMGERGRIAKEVRRAARRLRGERPGTYRIRLDVLPIVHRLLTEADAVLFEREAWRAVASTWHPELVITVRELADPDADFAVELEALPDPSAPRRAVPAGATEIWRTSAPGDVAAGALWVGPLRFRLVCEEPRGVFTARLRARETMRVGRQDFSADGQPLVPMRGEQDGVTVIAVPTTNETLSRRAFTLHWHPEGQTPAWRLEAQGRNRIQLQGRAIEQGNGAVVRCGERFRIGSSEFHLEEVT